jgi:hypothetical protein
MNFSINVNKWVSNMIPGAIRKPVMKAYTKVLAAPMLAYYAITEDYYLLKLDEIAPFVLTDYLQARLRVLYPNVGSFKCFVINNHDDLLNTYIHYKGEHHAAEFVFKKSEGAGVFIGFKDEYNLAYDYTVIVPVSYTSSSPIIVSFLNKYKPAGKRYLLKFENKI